MLGIALLVGCGPAQTQASPTNPPAPTQPAAPTGLPANLPLPAQVSFLAQQMTLTMPLKTSTITTHATWLWSVPLSATDLIGYYQTNLPTHHWAHVTMDEEGDGPTLSACGKAADGKPIILEVEAAPSITGFDSANNKQTYTAPSGGTLLIVGTIPSTNCATLLGM